MIDNIGTVILIVAIGLALINKFKLNNKNIKLISKTLLIVGLVMIAPDFIGGVVQGWKEVPNIQTTAAMISMLL